MLAIAAAPHILSGMHQGRVAHSVVRRTHEDRVLGALREFGPLTRSALGDRVGLSRTTLSEITSDLIRRGAVVAIDDRLPGRGRGRPASRIALQPAVSQALGLDFGHGQVRAVAVNASRAIVASGAAEYASSSFWSERAATALALIDELGQRTGANFGALSGIGVGIPGPLTRDEFGRDPDSERIRTVRDALQERFGVPTLFDNNTRLAALGEATGGEDREDYAMTATDDLLYVRLSFGVGGGFVLDGRLMRGATGHAGEIGHVNVSPLGAPCRCGGRGCLETIAAIPAIIAAASRRTPAVHNLATLHAACASGDPIVAGVLREAGQAVGRVLADVAGVVNPSVAVIGGDMRVIDGPLFDAARAEFEQRSTPSAGARLEQARVGEDAGALGAIMAVFQRTRLLAGYAGSAGLH